MDTKEYERLTSLLLDSVYRVAVNGCRNYTDAEDIVQNTFLKLWQKKDGFESDDHARRWLLRVAVNECNSLWRSPWKRKTSSLEELAQEPVFTTPEKSSLYDAVKELPQKNRLIVYLYYFEDYSVKEVAQMMGLSESAVQNRLFRAREKLKEILKEA